MTHQEVSKALLYGYSKTRIDKKIPHETGKVKKCDWQKEILWEIFQDH